MHKHAKNGDKLIKNAKLFIAIREHTDEEEKKANILKCLHDGSDVNTRFENDNNNTALHISVITGDKEIVKFLIELGANGTLKNSDGKTALDIATDLHTTEGYEILQILSVHGADINTKDDKQEAVKKCEEMPNQGYKKRSGTSGVSGQLFETKLLTLVFLRALTNKDIEDFILATNIDEIGALDDLCIRYRQEGKDVVMFLQAKHKNDAKKGKISIQDLWRSNGDYSLPKYFDSYLKIRQKFNVKNKHCIFDGHFNDVKCIYVLHTTGNHDLNERKRLDKVSVNKTVLNLVSTGDNANVFQYDYDDRDVDMLTKTLLVQQMKQIGKKLIEFFQDHKYKMMMNDEHIRNFHVVLAHEVINVSKLNAEGYRTGTFREEFFSSNNKLLIILRETLYREALKKTKLQTRMIDESMAMILYDKNVEDISLLIGHAVHYDTKNHVLTVDENISKDSMFGKRLSDLQIEQAVVNEAYNIAGKQKLISFHAFKLPAEFGNSDLTVIENKRDKRLTYLAEKIIHVINTASGYFITINENIVGPNKLLDSGVIDVNGGLGSAIGNLLIIDEASRSLKFNVDDSTLERNAKTLLEKLNDKIPDLSKYRFIIDINGFPRMSLDPAEYEKSFAKDFLNNLWFYACQAKVDVIETIAKCEIAKHQSVVNQHPCVYQLHSDAVFLKIHDTVQKWWMVEHHANYLTKKTQYLSTVLNDIVDSPLLNLLNFIYLNKATKNEVEFNSDVIESLHLYENVAEFIICVSDANVLTGAKFVQYFNKRDNYKFIDLVYVLSLPNDTFDSLINEIVMMVSNQTLIIVYNENDTSIKDQSKLRRLIHGSKDKRLIIVTSKIVANEIEENISDRKYLKVTGERIKFSDLTLRSQKNILQTDFVFQGDKMKLDTIFDSESIHLITADVILKILNRKIIEIGNTLFSPQYDAIKEFYVRRRLRNGKQQMLYWRTDEPESSSSTSTDEDTDFLPLRPKGNKKIIYEIKTLKDLQGTVVILAAPGMGKSTLLTHLSIETKKNHSNIWIERINLLDHTRQFRKWQENKANVDIKEAMKFVCNVALTKNESQCSSKREYSNEIVLELDLVDEKIVLKDARINNDLELFELQLFIHLYNKGQVILLFDGFDEICPHYKREITEMLKCISMATVGDRSKEQNEKGYASGSSQSSESKQGLWITSRSYNNIKNTLEYQFGTAYTLEALSFTEQGIYLESYFNSNLNLNTLNYEQFKNVDGLIDYMRQFDKTYYMDDSMKIVKSTGVTLHRVYSTAVKYFQSQIKYMPLTADNFLFKAKWNLDTRLFTMFDKFLGNSHEYNIAVNLAGTPLHIYLAADYFQHVIREINCSQDDIFKKWDLDSNTFAFYARFLDTKLKKIRFEEKNKMDTSNPDIQLTYEKELKDFTEKHKKLAFYALFNDNLGGVLGDDVVDEIKDTIKRMESAEEKTGLVDCIVNGVPRFVHLVFAEYFAVEFIADKLKIANTIEMQKVIWHFILNKVMFGSSQGIMDVFDHKVKSDTQIADTISSVAMREYIFEELKLQTIDPYPPEAYEDLYRGDEAAMACETAVNRSVNYGLKHITDLLLRAIVDLVNEDNLDMFIELVNTRNRTILSMVMLRYDDQLKLIIDTIRRIDARKIRKMYDNNYPTVDIVQCRNDEIINDLRDVTTRMIDRSSRYNYYHNMDVMDGWI